MGSIPWLPHPAPPPPPPHPPSPLPSPHCVPHSPTRPTHPPSSNYNQSRSDGAVNQTVNCHFGRFCLSCLCLSVSCHRRSQTRLSHRSRRVPATFLFPSVGRWRRSGAGAHGQQIGRRARWRCHRFLCAFPSNGKKKKRNCDIEPLQPFCTPPPPAQTFPRPLPHCELAAPRMN